MLYKFTTFYLQIKKTETVCLIKTDRNLNVFLYNQIPFDVFKKQDKWMNFTFLNAMFWCMKAKLMRIFIFVSWKVIILEMMLNACDKISC